MKKQLPYVLGSLVGALAIHGALVACSSASSPGAGGPEGVAHADTGAGSAASACAKWEVKTVTPKSFTWQNFNYVDIDGKPQTSQFPTIGATELEEGWEPVGVVLYSPLVRRCIK